MSTFQKQRFKGSGGNPQSPGAFGTFLVEKYIEKIEQLRIVSNACKTQTIYRIFKVLKYTLDKI